MPNKLTEEEKAEVEARKRHRPMNDALRRARGTAVSVGGGTPESSAKMGSFIRQSTGRTNGKGKWELMKLKRQAVEQGYLINSKGEIIHDVRSDAETEAQGHGS